MKHKLVFNERRSHFGCEEEYETNEVVIIRIPACTDTSTYVTSPQTEIQFFGVSEGFLQYRFFMPDTDVYVDINEVNTMVYRAPAFPMNFSLEEANGKVPLRVDEDDDEERVVCKVCGTVNRATANFCKECGSILEKVKK